MQPYLADVFGTLKRKQHLDPRVIYTFPLVLDVSEVEALKPYLEKKRVLLVECLMGRIGKGAFGFLSFRDFLREYLEQRGIERVNDEEMIARFHQIMERISQRFFKKPFKPTAN